MNKIQKKKLTGKVLIVEDSLVTLEIIGEMLENLGLDVKKEEDEIRAIEIFKKENFDLVITDIYMSKIGGVELVKRLKEIRKGIKVIGITGVTHKICDRNFDKVLKKPITQDDLYNELEKNLNGVSKQFTNIIKTDIKNKKFINLMEKFRVEELRKVIKFLENDEKERYKKVIHKMSGSLKFWGNYKANEIMYKIQTKKLDKKQKIKELKILDTEIQKEINNLKINLPS